MKKILSFFIAALMIAAGIIAFASVSFAQTDKGFPQVADFTGSLTDDQLQEYEAQLLALKDEYSYDAAVAIVDADTLEEYGYTSLESFADDLYDNGGYGVGSTNDGILVLLRIGEPYSNHFHLCTTGHLIAICTEDDIDDMYYDVKPYLTKNDISGAVKATISAERDFFNKAKGRTDENGDPLPEFDPNYEPKEDFNSVKSGIIALAVGAVVGGVSANAMKSQLKSVRSKYSASDYVVPGTFNLTDSRDMFLYTHVSKVARPQDDSSRGSGGGGGAGFHFSSSGVSHGGGTR